MVCTHHKMGIDMSKALDTIKCKQILDVLLQAGCDNYELRFVRSLLANTRLRVQVNSKMSASFKKTTSHPKVTVYYQHCLCATWQVHFDQYRNSLQSQSLEHRHAHGDGVCEWRCLPGRGELPPRPRHTTTHCSTNAKRPPLHEQTYNWVYDHPDISRRLNQKQTVTEGYTAAAKSEEKATSWTPVISHQGDTNSRRPCSAYARTLPMSLNVSKLLCSTEGFQSPCTRSNVTGRSSWNFWSHRTKIPLEIRLRLCNG